MMYRVEQYGQSQIPKSWHTAKEGLPFSRDYIIYHKNERIRSRALWWNKVIVEHKKHDDNTLQMGKQLIQIGSPDALLKIFDDLDKNEDLASSVEGVMKWTRSLKPRDISF